VTSQHTVLLYGGTGRTGGRVLTQLLDRGVAVRAIVRDAARLPDGVADHPIFTVVEADLLGLSPDELRGHLDGCDTVISCLGHTISVRGILGPPHNLVTRAVRRTCEAIEGLQPTYPVRLVLMSSVSVNRPMRGDSRRRGGERAYLAVIRALTPPAKDNQAAADYLAGEVGSDSRAVEWVVVRPDTLEPGDVSEYRASPETTTSLFRPDHTRMANVAHFMGELTTDPDTWTRWRYAMPVLADAA
jgi:uncharacterized protein YbjT (DUF2867 family)